MPVRCHQCVKGGTKETQATFGIPGKTGGEWACKNHKKKGMVDLKNPRCQQETCNKQAGFGLEGGKKSFCNGHKEDGMVDLTHKKCVSNGCGKQAKYGPEGGPKTLCTRHHRESEKERVDMTPEHKPEVRAAGTVRGAPSAGGGAGVMCATAAATFPAASALVHACAADDGVGCASSKVAGGTDRQEETRESEGVRRVDGAHDVYYGDDEDYEFAFGACSASGPEQGIINDMSAESPESSADEVDGGKPPTPVASLYAMHKAAVGKLGSAVSGGAFYSELGEKFLGNVIRAMKVKGALGPDSKVIDLGSGTGKASLHFAQEENCAMSLGIEYDKQRYDLSMVGLQRVLESNPDQDKISKHKTMYVHGLIGDMKTFDPFTVIFMLDTGFDSKLMEHIAKVFTSSKTEYVVSSKPKQYLVDRGFPELKLVESLKSGYCAGGKSWCTMSVYHRATPGKTGPAGTLTERPEDLLSPAIKLVEEGDPDKLRAHTNEAVKKIKARPRLSRRRNPLHQEAKPTATSSREASER